MLPTVDLGGRQVTRLICGGNPLSGFSHLSAELDWEMIEYYTMPNIQALLHECFSRRRILAPPRTWREYSRRACSTESCAWATVRIRRRAS